MPGRKTVFFNGGFYHIFNRGNDKKPIFLKKRDYYRFLQTLNYYQFQGPKPRLSLVSKKNINNFLGNPNHQLVEIICYCLMPNHFHLLLKQVKDNGISIFLSQISNSYTKYFNIKYQRVGALLQGVFKSTAIESDEQFLHVSRYIHLNPVVSSLAKNLNSYQWSSFQEYINNSGSICSRIELNNFFPTPQKHLEFISDQIGYGKNLEKIKHCIIEDF